MHGNKNKSILKHEIVVGAKIIRCIGRIRMCVESGLGKLVNILKVATLYFISCKGELVNSPISGKVSCKLLSI